MIRRVAVIDIGTLKVKTQIISATTNKQLKTLYQSNVLTCLGVGMAENGNQPKPEYLNDTITELKRVKLLLSEHKVDTVRVVSTHALREMGEVGSQIVATIAREVGLNVEVISQQEEAELFFRAVLRDFTTDEDFTIIDVGGGSVQILVGNRKKLKQAYLLHMGAQYLFDTFANRHTENDFPKREEIRAMQQYILEQLQPLPKNLKAPIIYGSSCIIDVFKAVGLPLGKFSYSAEHPYKANVKDMQKFLHSVIPIPYGKREELYPFQQKYYMWGIDKAFLNIVTTAKKTEAPFVIPSNANINQGLLASMLL